MGNSFWCAEMLNWVLKLFSLHDIMSKARMDSSGGSISLRPFFARRSQLPLLDQAIAQKG
jgi:hypothetical protein